MQASALVAHRLICPLFPALRGGFLTSGPPGKHKMYLKYNERFLVLTLKQCVVGQLFFKNKDTHRKRDQI